MRVFTKILKIAIPIFREEGLLFVVYIDDSYLQGGDYEDYFSNVLNAIKILRSLGFSIHPDKSKFIPKQCITHLRFILNSVQLTITLTLKKKEKSCQKLFAEDVVTKRFLLKLIRNSIVAFPAVTFGPFYYRTLVMDNVKALQKWNLWCFSQII